MPGADGDVRAGEHETDAPVVPPPYDVGRSAVGPLHLFDGAPTLGAGTTACRHDDLVTHTGANLRLRARRASFAHGTSVLTICDVRLGPFVPLRLPTHSGPAKPFLPVCSARTA